MFAIIGMLIQLPFLIPGALIGPHYLFPIGERFELFLIKVLTWSRWLYVPATAALLYDMIRSDVSIWVPILIGIVDCYLLISYWNAGRRALEGFEDVEDDELENRDV
jgi:hypothetical protein